MSAARQSPSLAAYRKLGYCSERPAALVDQEIEVGRNALGVAAWTDYAGSCATIKDNRLSLTI